MSNEFSINALVADLRPVRRRSAWRDVAVLAGVAGAELAAWLLLGFARPDLGEAMHHPYLPWLLASLLMMALFGAATALWSLAPERSPRAGLGWTAAGLGGALLIGGVLGAVPVSVDDVVARLNWRDGLMCVGDMIALSVVPAVVLGILARRGAPTHLGGTALASGVAAASWGAFVFAFACPANDPLYIVVWYLVGCGAMVLVAWSLIARLARW